MQAAVVDDRELLARYAREGDQSAFADLVGRYVNLVYSAAARRVGDRHLAEDVTQAVFVILSQKARSIRDDTPLSSWLLTTARYAAANAVKMERRRRQHERAAAAAAASQFSGAAACSSNPSDVILWQEIATHLDDAILRLSADDRLALLLRYFEDRPLRDVAAALRVSEVAARQRVSRAVDKLRQRLQWLGAGVETVGAGAFVELLTSHAVRAAPIGLAQAACAAATAGAGAAAGTGAGITIAKGAIRMMTWTKLKIAAAVVAAVTVGATGTISMKNAMAADRGPAAAGKPMAAPGDAKPNPKDATSPSFENAPPVVVKTVPQAGDADVDASTTEIRVTYSKDMLDGSWSWSTWGQELYPKTTGKPHYEPDKRTCVLPVKLEPGHTYAIWLNSQNFGNFRDPDGHSAVPYLLIFETKK